MISLPKIFDCLVNQFLVRHFYSKLNSFQHGFISNKSTVTNLMTFTEYVLKCFEGGTQVDVIYIDYKKAFDRVKINLLLLKLLLFGFCLHSMNWFASYFSKRR